MSKGPGRFRGHKRLNSEGARAAMGASRPRDALCFRRVQKQAGEPIEQYDVTPGSRANGTRAA